MSAVMTPLEEKKLDYFDETGKCVPISVLDAVWSKEIDFLPYCSPYCASVEPTSDVGFTDQVWMEAMGWLDNDLQQLLEMTYHMFWCQVIHDSSLQRALDSYLQHGPRPFDRSVPVPEDVQEKMKSVHRRVFAVLLRLSTHKESQENFMSPEFYAHTIYSNHLFDIPRLLDLCAIYGETNKDLVSKMVGNIIRRQPRYEEDWSKMVGAVLEELSATSERVMSTDREAQRLASHARFSASDFSDLVLHLADFAATLRSFLTIYPPGVRELIRAHVVEKLMEFYEAVIPRLQENWHGVKGNLKNTLYVKRRLRSLKADLAWLVHECLHIWYLSPPPADSSGVRSKVSMDGFISVMSDMASESNFLREYKKCFEVVEEVRSVQRAHPEMPEDQFDYLISALEEKSTVSSKERVPRNPPSSPMRKEKEPEVLDETITDSLVSQVKDLLPHLGTGFIKILLREFGNDTEAIINSVLEDNLPPHLKGLDFSLATDETPAPLPKPSTQYDLYQPDSLVDQRESVYDGDEFDVFRKPGMVDLSRVHVGKRFDPVSVASVLNDKSHLLETRDRYLGYQVETRYDYVSEDQACRMEMDGECDEEPVPYMAGLDIMYEDEYDDTYDSQNVGAADDATDEQFVVKRLNKKGLFGKKLHEIFDDEEVEAKTEKKPVLQHPIILKRPNQSGERSNEQLQVLQSVKGVMADFGRSKVGKDSREKTGKDKQETWNPKGGEEWRRKGEKAKWRGRDREEEGGVVEVKTGDRRGGGRGRGQEDWRSTSRGKEGKPLDVVTTGDRRRGGSRQEYSKERQGGFMEMTPSGNRIDGDISASKEADQFEDHLPERGGRHDKKAPGRTLKEWTPSSAAGETSLLSGGQEKRIQPVKNQEEGGGHSASSLKHSELRSRQVKDRNKSSRANHNRRNLADKKRRGGMY